MRVLIVLVLLSLTIGCRKTKLVDGQKRLPTATEEGRGIFGCYINETTYTARKQGAINYNTETGYLFIENSNKQFEFRLFVYEGIFSAGTYEFENTDEEWINSDYTSFYGINEGGVNELIISKIDFTKKIIAGTFNIDLIDEAGNEKLIREGRFDLQLNYTE